MEQTVMQRDMVIARLKERGCRITKQRLLLLDIILKNEFASSKEIYYMASQVDKGIGAATVYRMVNTLEDIGAISRKNMYRIACAPDCDMEDACSVVFESGVTMSLNGRQLHEVLEAGLESLGYAPKGHVQSVSVKSCAGNCGHNSN